MELLTWTSDYSVGVQTLDNQHTVFINLINELHAAMESGQARNRTGTILRKLLNYTRGHFSAEEAMMASARYPGLAQHRNLHRDLTRHVEAFEARFERGEGSANYQLVRFLRDWIEHHIQNSDKDYGPWINRSGIR